MYFFELFPKEQKIEMICKIFNDYLDIYESFEFNSKYCILITTYGILFYNWKKNNIIRSIELELEKSSYMSQSILCNKFYLIGIYKNCIYFYNILEDKLYEYSSKEGLLTSYKNNKYKFILKISNNFCIAWNDLSYYIINIYSKGLKIIQKGNIYENNQLSNNINKYKSNDNDNDNESYSNSNSNSNSDSNSNYSYDNDKNYNEGESVDDDYSDYSDNIPKHLFSNNDYKNVFSKSLFDNNNLNNRNINSD